jgi:conjugal transfer pilus assembly protein TraF
MRNAMLIPLLLLACASHAQTGGLDYPSIWRCDEAKFNWYCDADEEPRQSRREEAPKAPANAETPVAKRVEIKDIKTAEQLRAELKRREDSAVMNPTDQNLKDYLALWQLTQEKGAVFADNWRRVVWQTPELDYSLKRPTNNSAVKTYDASREAKEEQQLRMVAKDHGLIFFFRSDCPYCHAMAPVLKMLSQRYGIEVLGVTIDGGGLPDFPNASDGRTKAAAWGVERVPALFIGSKKTGDKAAIGFGAMAATDIVNRIFVLTGTKPGDNF